MKKDFNDSEIMTDFFSTGNNEGTKEEQRKKQPIKENKKPFQISIKIDEDIEDFIKQIQWIKRDTRTAYINELIREDMKAFLQADEDNLTDKWEEYKNKVGL